MSRSLRGTLLAIAFAVLGAGGARADESPAFYEAAAAMADGRYAMAASAFEALAARNPDDPFADDALIEAADLYEHRLGDPLRARQLYRRVVDAYPDSRVSRRARRRLEVLGRALGEGAEHAGALARYRSILTEYGEVGPIASIRTMEALLVEHPEFPLAAEARLWIGTTYQQEARLDEALGWFRAVQERHPGTEIAWRAGRAEGDVLLARGDFDAAEAVYRSLAEVEQPALATSIAMALEEVERVRQRARQARLAWIVVALFAAAMLVLARRDVGSWTGAGRALLRPPIEFWYLLPVAAIVAIAAHTDNQLVADAVTTIVAGALGVSWLSGATLEAARRRGPLGLGRIAAQAAAAGLAVLAICYLALMQDLLLDLLEHTRRFGHE